MRAGPMTHVTGHVPPGENSRRAIRRRIFVNLRTSVPSSTPFPISCLSLPIPARSLNPPRRALDFLLPAAVIASRKTKGQDPLSLTQTLPAPASRLHPSMFLSKAFQWASGREGGGDQAAALTSSLGRGDAPVLLLFHSPGCRLCGALRPRALGEAAPHLRVVLLNIQEPSCYPEMLRYNVNAVPQLVMLNPAGDALSKVRGGTASFLSSFRRQ